MKKKIEKRSASSQTPVNIVLILVLEDDLGPMAIRLNFKSLFRDDAQLMFLKRQKLLITSTSAPAFSNIFVIGSLTVKGIIQRT